MALTYGACGWHTEEIGSATQLGFHSSLTVYVCELEECCE